MPRIQKEKKKSAKEIEEQISLVEEEGKPSSLPQKERKPKAKKKKPFNYPLAYVIISIFVFVLGILTICLINYLTGGSFSL